MSTELRPGLDGSVSRRFATVADEARVQRAAAALEGNGISVLRAADAGSVHAVTETGSLVVASMSGSQLGPYAAGAGRVILVVGTQKIVSDLKEGLRRIDEYAFPLEDARAQAAYGVHSAVNKVLVINRELTPAASLSSWSTGFSGSNSSKEQRIMATEIDTAEREMRGPGGYAIRTGSAGTL